MARGKRRATAGGKEVRDTRPAIRRHINGDISPSDYVREVTEHTRREFERELAEKDNDGLNR